jgi:ketosteroid isomerase-like protein
VASAVSASELDQLIEEQHRALGVFVQGDHEPLAALLSRVDDVTLGNPFGPFVRGYEQAVETMKRAATNYRDGEVRGFDQLSSHVTADLACIVEVERYTAKVAGRKEATPLSLRCTSVFRRENGSWRLVHRHADPITTTQPPDSVIEK